MPQQEKYPDNQFVVKESATTNYIIGTVFLILFFLVLHNIIDDTGATEYYTNRNFGTYGLALLMFTPVIVFFVKGFYQPTIITVNKDGFYYYGELKTTWKNFISAEVTEEEKVGSYQDNFIFILHFYKPGEEGYFETKIPMRNTYNKSGEEIIEAIKYFRPLPPLTSELSN